MPSVPSTRLKPRISPARERTRARQIAASGWTGPPSKTTDGSDGHAAPAAEHLANGNLGRAVEHHAERAAALVRDEQDDGAFEVRVAQPGSRDEQMPDQRLHRPPLRQIRLARVVRVHDDHARQRSTPCIAP